MSPGTITKQLSLNIIALESSLVSSHSFCIVTRSNVLSVLVLASALCPIYGCSGAIEGKKNNENTINKTEIELQTDHLLDDIKTPAREVHTSLTPDDDKAKELCRLYKTIWRIMHKMGGASNDVKIWQVTDSMLAHYLYGKSNGNLKQPNLPNKYTTVWSGPKPYKYLYLWAYETTADERDAIHILDHQGRVFRINSEHLELLLARKDVIVEGPSVACVNADHARSGRGGFLRRPPRK